MENYNNNYIRIYDETCDATAEELKTPYLIELRDKYNKIEDMKDMYMFMKDVFKDVFTRGKVSNRELCIISELEPKIGITFCHVMNKKYNSEVEFMKNIQEEKLKFIHDYKYWFDPIKPFEDGQNPFKYDSILTYYEERPDNIIYRNMMLESNN